MKTVKELLKEKLVEIGADGLCNSECGCEIDDLYPCYAPHDDCVAAKNNPKKAKKMQCDFWMEPMEV